MPCNPKAMKTRSTKKYKGQNVGSTKRNQRKIPKKNKNQCVMLNEGETSISAFLLLQHVSLRPANVQKEKAGNMTKPGYCKATLTAFLIPRFHANRKPC